MKIYQCVIQDLIHKNKKDQDVVVRKDDWTLYSCSLVPLKYKVGDLVNVVVTSDTDTRVKWFDPVRVSKELKEAKKKKLLALKEARENKKEIEMKKVSTKKSTTKKVAKKAVAKKATKPAKKATKKSCKK